MLAPSLTRTLALLFVVAVTVRSPAPAAPPAVFSWQQPAAPQTGEPPADDLVGVLQPHVYPLERNGGFDGPALQWIVDNAADVQFVMFGEQHGIDAIPRIVGAAYERLHALGFHHLALETGPWIAATLSETPVDEAIARYPHSITFDYDADLEPATAHRSGVSTR